MKPTCMWFYWCLIIPVYKFRGPFPSHRYKFLCFPLTAQVPSNDSTCKKILKRAQIKEAEIGKTKVMYNGKIILQLSFNIIVPLLPTLSHTWSTTTFSNSSSLYLHNQLYICNCFCFVYHVDCMWYTTTSNVFLPLRMVMKNIKSAIYDILKKTYDH